MEDYEQALKELEDMGIKPVQEEVKTDAFEEMSEQIASDISSCTGVKFSDEQKRILKHKGNMTVITCAGSGKTTILTNLIAKRIKSGEIRDTARVICTTYSKAGATEMQERINSLMKKLGLERYKLEVRTLHSFFYSLINLFGLSYLKVLSSEAQRMKFIKEACKEADYVCKDDDLMIMSNLLSFQVNNILKAADTISSYVCTLDDLTLEQYIKIRKGYDLRKAKENLIDFDDMQLYLYKWLCKDINSSDENVRATGVAIRDYCRAMWDYFFIDEAQDISKIQYEIIKAIIKNPSTGKVDKSLILTGDDDQCIYKWRGAEPDIIITSGEALGMDVKPLNTNYRCKSNIVDFASMSIRKNNYRHDKEMKAHTDGGKVSITTKSRSNLYSMCEEARRYIKKLVEDGEDCKNIAVLARNNIHVAIMNIMLEEESIYCSASPDARFTNHYMYKDIKSLLQLADGDAFPDLTRQMLWKVIRYSGVKVANDIASFQSNTGMDLKRTLGYILKEILGVKINEDFSSVKIPYKVIERLKYRFLNLKEETLEDLAMLYDTMSIEDEQQRFNGLKTLYINGTSFLYKNEDKARSIKACISVFEREIKQKGFRGALNFFRVAEQLDNGSIEVPGSKVTVSTIHGAKGKEWKHVILLACDNLAMPCFSNISKMLEDGLCIEDVNNYIDEERRLYYVGCTRAKDDLLIISGDKPSIFVLESLGIFGKEFMSNNYSVIELVNNSEDYSPYMNEVYKMINDEHSKYRYTYK